MFKTKKGFCMKSNEELQSYIICLRKQLAISSNENRALKIKINRLENDIQKKDEQIQSLVASSKDFDIKKMLKKHGKGLILNMQKQIHHLEEQLLQIEMTDEIKTKSQKKSDYKTLKRKESKVSVRSVDSLSLTEKIVSSQHSLDQRKVSMCEISKCKDDWKTKSENILNGQSDKWEIDDSCLNIIKMLKEQTNTEKFDNKTKNNQISYLLQKLKSFKKVSTDSFMYPQKLESPISASRSSTHSSSTLNPEKNSDDPNKYRNENHYDNPLYQYDNIVPADKQDDSSNGFMKSPKHTNLHSPTIIDNKHKKQETQIDYSYDSEVSCDEDYQ